jgi:hypothetical protein
MDVAAQRTRTEAAVGAGEAAETVELWLEYPACPQSELALSGQGQVREAAAPRKARYSAR